jgi:omega-6 fatty acid desaturase (delta-12 desaturase)
MKRVMLTDAAVAITYLQHTDPSLPHYEDGAWNFQRGAAATIDRDLGLIGTYLMHGIISTHVLHHFVSTIPFYHADEASEAIKPVMGKHYRQKIGGFWYFIRQMWMAARECQWVEPCPDVEGVGKNVFFYRNRNKRGVPPAKLPKPEVSALEY